MKGFMINISFDLDFTLLTNKKVQELCLNYRNINKLSGKEIFNLIITTRRNQENFKNEYGLSKFLTKYGFKKSDVCFTNGKWKAKSLIVNSIDIHYDDDINELEEYNRYCESRELSIDINGFHTNCKIIIIEDEDYISNESGILLPKKD